MTFPLADAASPSWNFFAPLGVTSWEALVACLIAFFLMVVVLRAFAFKPIHEMLMKRRERIAEGEDMRKESERQLNQIQQTTKDMLAKAGEEGRHHIEEAKLAAAKLIETKGEEASKQAQDIIAKAREAAAQEARKAQDELKSEFMKLVALTASQVTGKVLTEEDQRKINQDVINSLEV